MNTKDAWNLPKNAKAIVVLKDGCLSTYKVVRGYFEGDHKAQLEHMVSGMDNKYFNRPGDRIEVVGKVCETWEEAEGWVRSFKPHPEEAPHFYSSTYCTCGQQWIDICNGKYVVPVGEKTTESYVPKEGEHVIECSWGVYAPPEVRNT